MRRRGPPFQFLGRRGLYTVFSVTHGSREGAMPCAKEASPWFSGTSEELSEEERTSGMRVLERFSIGRFGTVFGTGASKVPRKHYALGCTRCMFLHENADVKV
jgi:hypothetical protein